MPSQVTTRNVSTHPLNKDANDNMYLYVKHDGYRNMRFVVNGNTLMFHVLVKMMMMEGHSLDNINEHILAVMEEYLFDIKRTGEFADPNQTMDQLGIVNGDTLIPTKTVFHLSMD